MENIDQIQKYLNNELDNNELIIFNKKLIADPAFKEEVEEFKLIFSGFNTLKAEAFEQKLRESEETNNTPLSVVHSPNKAKFTLLKRAVLAAAMVAILGIVYFWNFQSNNLSAFVNDEMQEAKIDIRELKETVRDPKRRVTEGSEIKSEESQKIINNTITFLEKEEYSNAISESAKISVEDPNFQMGQYIRALSHFTHQEFSESSDLFKGLFEQEVLPKTLEKNELGWMYVLSELKIFQKDKSELNKQNLNSSIDFFLKNAQQGVPYYIEKAEELKKYLN